MFAYPVEKLGHGINLVVETAVRELDHLVDKFGDPPRPSGRSR
jgi:hypothetical protein